MTATDSLSTDHSRAVTDGAHSHDDFLPDASRGDRFKSFEIGHFPVPHGREEDWRFTPIDRLQGIFQETYSGIPAQVTYAGETATFEVVSKDDARVGKIGAPSDRASVAAWANSSEAHVLTIPANAVLEKEVVVTITGSGLGASAQHLVILAENHSESTVVIDHVGVAELAQTVEVHVGDGAHLNIVSLHDWARGSIHTSDHRMDIGRDAILKHTLVTLGGDVVRITPDAVFTQPGSEVELNGLYFADAGQHQEHRILVDHAVPHCKSDVKYKGALQGQDARSVWFGDVLIRKEAEGTDTYELNRNLVLTKGARADSVPNLEIETGEIEGAGHASATGRFDDEQLFYLMSRGVDELSARRLVVRGFFAELIQEIGVPNVEERLLAAIEAELDASLEAK